MFHDVPAAVIDRMRHLERIDAADRTDGTPRLQRLRQIPPETGRFIALLAAAAPEGDLVEIGTSAGYSTMWLALAGRVTGRTVTSYEVMPEKHALARETIELAGISDAVELVLGDARDHLAEHTNVGFCFLDAEKEAYGDCYDLVVPRLTEGGLLVADNAINHRRTLQPMIDRALSDRRVDALVVPIGKGELVCRRSGPGGPSAVAV